MEPSASGRFRPESVPRADHSVEREGDSPGPEAASAGQCLAASSHPSSLSLERFMRGRLSRAEVQGIVRRLLAGCPECRQVTSALWRFPNGTLPYLGAPRNKARHGTPRGFAS